MNYNEIIQNGRLIYESQPSDKHLTAWLLNSTQLSVSFYKETPLSPIDILICSILNKNDGQMKKQDLGLTLGFDIATTTYNGQTYYTDVAECEMYNRLLSQVTDWNLVSVEKTVETEDNKLILDNELSNDEQSEEITESTNESAIEIVKLTGLGKLALEKQTKFTFYKSELLLYNNMLCTKDKNVDDKFLYPKELNICAKVINTNPTTIDPNNFSFKLDSPFQERLHLQLEADWKNQIFDIQPQEIIHPLERCSVDFKLYEYENQHYILAFKEDKLSQGITDILYAESNLKPRNLKIKRCLYYKLLNNPTSSFNYNEVKPFWDILEAEDYGLLVKDSRLDWTDSSLFTLIIYSEYFTTKIKTIITQTIPINVLKKYIGNFQEYLDWSILSSRIDVDFIIKNSTFPWSYDTVLNRNDLTQLEGQQILKLPIHSNEDLDWDLIEKYLTIDFVCENIDSIKFDHYHLTSWLPSDKISIIFKHLDKQWNWDYLTNSLSLQEIEENIEVLGSYINVISFIDRCFSDETNANFAIRSAKLINFFKTAISNGRFDNYSLQDKDNYAWTDLTIQFFEEIGLLSWVSKQYEKGFAQFKFVIWDYNFFAKYYKRVTCQEDKSYISSIIADINLISDFPDFDWDWNALSANRDIAYSNQFITTYKNKINVHAWIENASTESIESNFERLNLKTIFTNESSVKKLSQKATKEFIKEHRELTWSASEFTESFIAEAFCDENTFDKYIAKWDWEILSSNAPLSFVLCHIDCQWSSKVLTEAILSSENNIVDLINKHCDRIDWTILSRDISYTDFSLIAVKYCDKWDWNVINPRFTSKYTSSLLNNKALSDYFDWYTISSSANPKELVNAISLNSSLINWDLATANICSILDLSLLQDEIYFNKWNWQTISSQAETSLLEKIIDQTELPLYWEIVTERFSADFILNNLAKHQYKWDWRIIWDSKFNYSFANEKKEELANALNCLNSDLKSLQWSEFTQLFLKDNILKLSEELNPENGYNWDYKIIYDGIADIEQFVNEPHLYIDWSALSKSKAADLLFFHDAEIFDIRIWKVIVKKILSNPIYKWDFKSLTHLDNIQKQHSIFFKIDADKWDWNYISEFGLCLLPEFNGDANLRKYKERINFALVSKRTDICLNEETISSFIDEHWDWATLSANDNVELSIDFVLANKDKTWDWSAISRNESIKWNGRKSAKLYASIFKDENIIKAFDWKIFLSRRDIRIDTKLLQFIHTEVVDYWPIITSNKRFVPSIDALSIAEKDRVNPTSLNWDIISDSRYLIQYNKQKDGKSTPNYDFILKYASYINWEIATQNSVFDILNNSLLDSFKEYVDWTYISKEIDDDKLGLNYLNRYKKYLHWSIINKRFDYSQLNENALKELECYLDWTKVSRLEFQFTSDLLSSYVDRWDWSELLKNKAFKLTINDKELNLYKNKINVAKFIEHFEGREGKIYHFTHLFNVLEVLKSRKILSRNRALELSKLKFDSAGGVVGRTAKAHPFARFYYRPLTPTQFYNECLGWDCDLTINQGRKEKNYYPQALNLGLPKCPIPVFLEFDLHEVLTKMSSSCYYSNGNMQTNWAQVFKVEDAPDNIRMKHLYHNMSDAFDITMYETGDFDRLYFNHVLNEIKEQSQQEFLVKDQFDFSNIDSLKIHCYDEDSAKLLRKYLGKDPIAERIVIGGCFNYHNKDLNFNFDEDHNVTTISSTYNGQGDAYFLIKGDVHILNTVDTKRQIKDGLIMYPKVEIENTDKPFEVYFIDKRARTTDWLIYSNNIESSLNNRKNQYHIDDSLLEDFVNIKNRIKLVLESNLFYSNMLYSYHGIAHTARVLFATHLITSMSEGISEEIKDMAYYAAIIHDLGKTNDREGSIHGLKSLNRYNEFINNIDIDTSLKQSLKDAIRYHSVDDNLCPEHVRKDILWKILKDADALDRSRFGSKGCDVKYLRMPIFNTEQGQEILSITNILPMITNKCKWNDPYNDIIKTLKLYVL